jgi:hypothetical protein
VRTPARSRPSSRRRSACGACCRAWTGPTSGTWPSDAALHVCPGAPLARTELRLALETLLTRSNAITLSDGAVVAEGNHMTAGVGELYIDLAAA